MSSRFATPLVVLGLVVVVAVGALAGWFLARPPVVVAPAATPPPVVVEPEEVAVEGVPPPREIPPGPEAEFRAALRLVESAAINPDPRVADAESKPLFDRIDGVRAMLRDQPAAGVEAQLKQLDTAEATYRQRLARAADAWLVTFAEKHTTTAEKIDPLNHVRKRMLRQGITNPLRDDGPAAMTLEHLRRTQLEALVHRVAGKDHGDAAELVTRVMQLRPAADRLEAIDDEEADAAKVHAEWRGELAERFAKTPSDVKPAEVAAWLLSGCFPAAKPDKPSGAAFAFLDPARNPELVSATVKGPIRRIVAAWAANHTKDPAATAAATALLKASKP